MEKKSSVFSRGIEKLRDNKKLETGVYIGLLIIVVVIFVSTGGISCPWGKSGASDQTAQNADIDTDEELIKLESRLEEILSRIKGAGKVSVMITYEKGAELVPAIESQTSTGEGGSSESRRPVTVSQGGTQSPLVLAELYPSIRGVIVVAEGASDIRVRTELLNAVMTVLGTDAERISVFTMQ